MPVAPNISGQRFCRLIAVERTRLEEPSIRWLCVCDCGNTCTPTSFSLKIGRTKSCGCLRREVTSKRYTKHGRTNTPEYCSYNEMKKRCYKTTHKRYNDWGGRGIIICERWRGYSGFQNFIADMGPKPSPKHSLDRINNDGNYEPGNCRWATAHQQRINRRPVNRLK